MPVISIPEKKPEAGGQPELHYKTVSKINI
jgi:hypothetical protein